MGRSEARSDGATVGEFTKLATPKPYNSRPVCTPSRQTRRPLARQCNSLAKQRPAGSPREPNEPTLSPTSTQHTHTHKDALTLGPLGKPRAPKRAQVNPNATAERRQRYWTTLPTNRSGPRCATLARSRTMTNTHTRTDNTPTRSKMSALHWQRLPRHFAHRPDERPHKRCGDVVGIPPPPAVRQALLAPGNLRA